MTRGSRRSREILPADLGMPEQKRKANKMGAKKIIEGDKTFASTAQYFRYKALEQLERSGEIFDLRHEEPKFELQEGFRDLSGRWYRPITYTLDNCYRRTDTPSVLICEDVKGMETQQGRMRISMLLHRLYVVEQRLDISIRIVDKHGNEKRPDPPKKLPKPRKKPVA